MGLIKAGIGAIGGTLADQWKEFFYCDALASDVLVTKGQKRTSGRSSNTKASDNIISNGSGIAVADGQCMMIVEQGKVVELCAEPGEYTFDSSSEPSIFSGSLGKSIVESFKTIGKRFTYGGDTGKDQRVYYFNTKEIMDNKFGTPSPILFRFVDDNINLDVDISIRCNGIYSYKIVDPLKFYANVCGNVADRFTRGQIDAQLKAEFISALTPAVGELANMRIRPNALSRHTDELEAAMKQELNGKWTLDRGIEVHSINLMPISLSAEDEALIKNAQKAAMLKDPTYAAATLASAQADAMKAAASNENGAMMGFMSLNMANAAGGASTQSLYAMGAEQAASQPKDAWRCACGATASGKFCAECGAKKPEPKADGAWKCVCGATVSGKFCSQCGAKKPEDGWKCGCGAVNKGKFCGECGAKKPEGAPLYRCDKCGWEPADQKDPPRFCPECGDPFNDDDIK